MVLILILTPDGVKWHSTAESEQEAQRRIDAGEVFAVGEEVIAVVPLLAFEQAG